MKLRNRARTGAYFLLLLTAIGVSSPFNEAFVKVHAGPFYLLELVFGGVFLLSLLSQQGWSWRALAPLWPALAFFVFGSCLLGADLWFFPGKPNDIRAVQRTLQHAVVFFYPLMWMPLGVWLARTDRAVMALMFLLVIAANTVPNFAGSTVSSLSLGPLTALLLVVTLDKALDATKRPKERVIYAIVSAALALLTFTPYWLAWYRWESLQRTSLLVLLFFLTAPPLLRRKKLSSLKNVAITVTTFLLGFVAASTFAYSIINERAVDARSIKPGAATTKPTFADHFADNFFGSMQKPDDHPAFGPPGRFQGVTRKYWWKTAVGQWLERPVFGIGFIPEVPRNIEAGMPNTFETVLHNPRFQASAPISGPHNSYLTILARMGGVGLALFVFLLAYWIRSIWPLIKGRELNLYEILVILVPISGTIFSIFNIGFESPKACMLTWFFAGAATVYATSIAEAEKEANSTDD